jgi:hypothetical protein
MAEATKPSSSSLATVAWISTSRACRIGQLSTTRPRVSTVMMALVRAHRADEPVGNHLVQLSHHPLASQADDTRLV